MERATEKTPVGDMPGLSHRDTVGTTMSKDLEEKDKYSGSDSVEIASDKVPAGYGDHVLRDEDEAPVYLNGEPVITTGKDVSYFAVDIRDDGDAALTFRSIVLGTVFAGMGAALCQVRDS